MTARAVIGANFGDEGKGLVTDWLCATQGAGMVVRFNGGAQAGHTVVTPEGLRHVFGHFGSGTLCGVPTYLSHFFVVNPILFFNELEDLINLTGTAPIIYAHPNCLVTTFADMVINQRLEDARGDKRHGSCGVGINETINRSSLPNLKITMADIWNGVGLEGRLVEICDKYTEFRTGHKIDARHAVRDRMIAGFLERCAKLPEFLHPLGIQQCKDPLFEGAQGLLLDQDNKEFYPHVTRSSTGLKNVRALCAQAGIDKIEPYYVTRTYLTRHGAGPLPGHDPKMSFKDDTNVRHDYQGELRFAPLDVKALMARVSADANGPSKLAVTHWDQHRVTIPGATHFNGPTRAHAFTPAHEET